MKSGVTRAIHLFHVWAGIGLGAVFCVMSLSGSVLVLRPAIEDLLRPTWIPASSARPAQPLTAAADNIARRWPKAKIASVSLPETTDRPLEFGVRTGNGELRVFADARSSEILGTFDLPWLTTLTNLHHHILVESIGKKVVGFIGLLLVLSSLTGLQMWLRRSNRWKLLRMRGAAAWRYSKFDLHRLLGVAGNAALLFVAVTGVMMAFPQTITQMMGGAAPAAVRASHSHTEHSSGGATLPEYIHAAELAVPGGRVTELRLAHGRDGVVNARVRVPGDMRIDGSARVNLEAGTARVVSIDKPSDWPVARSIVEAATPLHYAEWGGMAIRGVWFFIGLIPPVLFVSGLMMWWAPVAAKRKAARIPKRATLVGA
jgi:uncharacterized iron-regulated membrane protein